MVPLSTYESERQRPLGRPVMRQRWRALLFLHFSTAPEEIQAQLPTGLTVDTYPDAQGIERAWVGLIPFRMEGVTPVGVPEIPGMHAFPETNVRTYVHREGKQPGVWFFSLEAANALACRVARRFFRLPYHEARMSVDESIAMVRYQSVRRSGGQVCNVECRLGAELELPKPGSLDFFLLERYLLYAYRAGELYTGRVHHSAYPTKEVTWFDYHEELLEAAGITPRPFDHAVFSPGVDVEVFGLKRADD